MAIGKNIAANIAGRIWSIISIYVFVPVYISLLGVESYGMITFYTMLLTILAFADVGLTATLNREFAKADIDDRAYKQNLLRTFEYTYILIGIVIISTIFLSAPLIVKYFIKSDTLSTEDLIGHIQIMGVIIAFYLISSLYNGGLMGLQQQVLSNTLTVAYGMVRSGVVCIPLIWIRDLNLYFYWQAGAVIFYFMILRYYLYRSIRVPLPIRPNFSYFKNIWKYAFGMMMMAVIYSINTQIDKLSISNLLSLKYFTYYSLSSMVGQGVLVLAAPIGMAFFPELTRLISIKDYNRTRLFYHKFAYIITAATSAVAVILIFYAYDYVKIWTRDAIIAETIESTTILLTLGALFMSIQLCPYYLALANGHTKTNVTIGIVTILCIIPSLQLSIPHFGLLGAAIPWLAINSSITVLLGYIIMKKFMTGEFSHWLIRDSALPMLVSFVLGTLLYFLFSFLPTGIYTIIYGIVIIIVIMIVHAIVFIRLYPEILHHHIIQRFTRK